MSALDHYQSPSTSAKYASTSSLTRVLIASLAVYAGLEFFAVLMNVLLLATNGAIAETGGLLLATAAVGIGGGLMLANMGLWLLWQAQAARTAWQWNNDATPMEHGPVTALIWWFVPVANLVKPFRVVREIWTTTATHLQDSSLPKPPLAAWWGLCLAALVSESLALWMDVFGHFTASQMVGIFANALGVSAAAAAALLVKRIDDAQVQVAHEKGVASFDRR